MKSSSASLCVCLVVSVLGCGGRVGAHTSTSDGPHEGQFLFDCVDYDIGCPRVHTIGETSQEPMPEAIAVGSTFLTSFYPDNPLDNAAAMSMKAAASTMLVDATSSFYGRAPFTGVEGTFKAVSAGDAEIDVVTRAGDVVGRTTVHLVEPARLAFQEPDGSDLALPVTMVPMGQTCVYVVPQSEAGDALAGLPNCAASASNESIQITLDEPPGVICFNGESYGSATVRVTCGHATSSFDVVLARPPVDDAGASDATVDAGDAADAGDADVADAHPCVTACGDAACVDTNDDPSNCGACGAVCDGACQRGRCIVTVATGQDHPFAIASDGTNVYWTNGDDNKPGNGSVMRAPVGGGAPTLVLLQDRPKYIVVDDTNAYWASANAIMRVPLAGGTPSMVSAQSRPYGIAVDAANLYWTNEGSGEVMKLALGGGDPIALTPPVVGLNPQQLVIDDTKAYWFNYASDIIDSVPLAGGPSTTFYYDSNFVLAGIAIDHENVYYTEMSSGGPVMALPRDGGAPHELARDNGTYGVVSDGQYVYFTSPDGNAPVFDGEVLRVPVDGGAPETLATGGRPTAIAIDGTNVYWISSDAGSVLRTAK